MKWFFIPFKQYAADPTMPQNEARYERRGVKIVKLGEEGGLKNVKANEILVIAGHGLPMVASLGVISATMSFGTLAKGETDRVYTMARLPSGATPSRPPDEVLGVNRLVIQDELTAHDLAEMLDERMGLPKSHVRIRLITCHGAGEADAVYNTATEQLVLHNVAFANCLASVLAKELLLRGYLFIMVQGYPGSVNASDDKKSIRFRNGDSCVSTVVPKFWFDGVGRHLAPWEVDVKVGAGEASVKFFSLFD